MPQRKAISVIPLLHEKRNPVRTEKLQRILMDVAEAGQRLWARFRSRLAEVGARVAGRRRHPANAAAALDLLEADDPPLPGTGTRAFWVGLSVVSLSLVSALATYLILTGLTPIVPRTAVVVDVLAVNLLLVIAMVVMITVQGFGLRRAWRK